MSRCIFAFISFICTIMFMACDYDSEDYKLAARNNPYDPDYLRELWGLEGREIKILAQNRFFKYPSWSPDETKISYGEGGKKQIQIINLEDGTKDKLPLMPGHGEEKSARWSPVKGKDSLIAYIHTPGNEISIRSYPGNEDLGQLTEDGLCQEGSLVWSRDGRKLAYIQRLDLKIMDADGSNKQEIKTRGQLKRVLKVCDWSPDGSKLMVIYAEELRAYTIDICTNSVEPVPTGEKAPCLYAVWSDDGSKILYVIFTYRYELWIMNSDGSNKAAILTGDIDPAARLIDSINWSRDGDSVLFIGFDQPLVANKNYICIMKMKSLVRNYNRIMGIKRR